MVIFSEREFLKAGDKTQHLHSMLLKQEIRDILKIYSIASKIHDMCRVGQTKA